MKLQQKRILIVGGVAGGASCATRLRRLCERCEIVLFDKGPHVSFANCGLPYFVGNVITEEAKLIVATPELFNQRFNIDVHVGHEVIKINREVKSIVVKNLLNGSVKEERYDALVLSTGSKAIRPPLPGINLPGIFVLRDIPDSHKLRNAAQDAKRAVIIGGGFIGLEMAENLVKLGIKTTIIEMTHQVMPPLDAEMAVFAGRHLRENGVELILGKAVESFSRQPDGLTVHYSDGGILLTDLVLLAIGVQPESALAKDAGLQLGSRGGIQVNATLQTSDPFIWAVGDVIEVTDSVTQQALSVPLAGPANRQGRIAADAIAESFGGCQKSHLEFRGVQGTAVCEIFKLTIALTGASEKALQRANITDYQAVYLHPGHHASYFPGAQPIHLKLLFSRQDGRILGAQAIGQEGVARRIDVIAMALQMGATVYDLEESELCYAPQFGAAKDPVNMAGMIASNYLRVDAPLADWSLLDDPSHYLLDVRSEAEFRTMHIPGASNIPLEQLRGRFQELPKNQEIWLVCGVGQRAYYAARMLLQYAYQVKILSGGMQTYFAFAELPEESNSFSHKNMQH
jgi:NADPH-dependent 2,4-dienoyl-CoA reductase/sulfur reductase-like enzyme/rhodanese-related sulfurtransferase